MDYECTQYYYVYIIHKYIMFTHSIFISLSYDLYELMTWWSNVALLTVPTHIWLIVIQSWVMTRDYMSLKNVLAK